MQLQEQDQFDYWNQQVHDICGNFVTRRGVTRGPFSGDIQSRHIGSLTIADIRTNAEAIQRGKGSFSRGDDSFYFLVLQCSGNMKVQQAGYHTFDLKPGDVALYDSAESLEMRTTGTIRQISLHIPRDKISDCLNQRPFRFGKVDSITSSGRAVRQYMLKLLLLLTSNEDVLKSEGFCSLENIINYLLVSELQSEYQRETIDTHSLRKRIEQIIVATLPHPITPHQLADQLGISVRHLYRQFEQDDTSIAGQIRSMRIHMCAKDLIAPDSLSMPLTDFAQKWGFADLAHFSKTFKRYLGVSPSQYRAMSNIM